MELDMVPEALELNRDYAVLLVVVNYLDEDDCAFADNGCTGDSDAQFYFTDHAGDRQLMTACFTCLVPAVRREVAKGDKVMVEVQRGL